MPSALSEILAVLAPPSCAACRRVMPSAHALVCGPCLAALPWLRGPRCARCGLPDHATTTCAGRGAPWDHAWSPMAYEGVARDLVWALKFGRVLSVADLLGAQIVAGLPRPLRGLPVVPVPAQPSRARRRGYDPAGVLAAAVARRAGVPLVRCLRRTDRAGRQVGARGSERRASRMRVRVAAPVPPRVLLVDDVHTTGTTMTVCADALRAAGTEQVAAISYARTV